MSTGSAVQERVEERKLVRARTERFAAGMGLYKLLWIFYIGSFAGVVIETLWCFVTKHSVESRVGLLYGPFNPVYGVGALLLTICLFKLGKQRDLIIFLCSMVIGGAFEYICSFLQELVFGTVSWEYSHTQFNFQGRTNVMYAFFWGLLGLVWVKDTFPRLSRMIEKIPQRIGKILTWALFLFMIFDILLTFGAVKRQSDRHDEQPAVTAAAQFFDKHYSDAYLTKKFPNMKDIEVFKKNKTAEKLN